MSDPATYLREQAQQHVEEAKRLRDIGGITGSIAEDAIAFALRRAADNLDLPAPFGREWKVITADQVRVGDDIEVTREWDGGRGVIAGVVTQIVGATNEVVMLGTGPVLIVDQDQYRNTVRRRVRLPMPEPDVRAAVRHAGRLLVRSEHQHLISSSWSWFIVSGPLAAGDRKPFGLTWDEVLELDPDTEPVVVDLGSV